MRSIVPIGACLAAVAALLPAPNTAAAAPSCTGDEGARVPRCRSTWRESTVRGADYDIRCEYACSRSREPWLGSVCRCTPPCGDVVVKKRLYKFEGDEKVERVPHYDVEMAPAAGCGCAACRARRPSGGTLLDTIPLFQTHARGTP